MSGGMCIHVAPSPGQSMCQCKHQQIEFEFARDILERSVQESRVKLMADQEMGYVKGEMDKGALAGTFMVIIKAKNAQEAAEIVQEGAMRRESFSVYDVHRSAYDIDYNVHKLIFTHALEVTNGK